MNTARALECNVQDNLLQLLSPLSMEDLKRSGLNEETIKKMNVRDATDVERNLTPFPQSTGYVIPYLNKDGSAIYDRLVTGEKEEIPFFRIRYHQPTVNSEGKQIKYAQPKDTGVHVYVLPEIWKIAKDTSKPLVIVEGEKKAAKAVQEGIPAIALGGVNNVKHGKYRIKPNEIEESKRGFITFTIKDADAIQLLEENVAPELLEFDWRQRTVYIVFDSDSASGFPVKEQVQQAAFDFAFWLFKRGADVKQVILPHPEKEGEKIGLDDFLLTHTADDFWELAKQARFPIQPQLRSWLQRHLRKRGLNRDDYEMAATAIVADLDYEGRRYRDEADNRKFYYFDGKDKLLYEVDWTENANAFRVGEFAELITAKYGIGTADREVINRLSTAFIQGCPRVRTRRVSYVSEPPKVSTDTLYVQLSDSAVAKVTKDAITLEDNGVDGVLFKKGIVKPVKIDFQNLPSRPKRLWRQVVNTLNLDNHSIFTDEEQRALLEVLCYLSPLFRDWRGLELPVEMAIGEAGSGKSRFYYVRTGVLVGEIGVGVTPRDIQELRTFLASARGIYVFDNVRPGSLRNYREQFEEEIARAVTLKKIQYRPLYSNTDVTIKTDCTFAITATRLPIHASDLMERSLVFRFKKIPEGQKVDDWEWKVLYDTPGREALLSDMLVAAQRFFQLVDTKFEAYRRKSIRLEGFERALLLMAEALDESRQLLSTMESVVDKLPQVIRETQYQADNALMVLREFAVRRRQEVEAGQKKPIFQLREITDWVLANSNGPSTIPYPFHNPQELAGYIREQEELVAEVTGIRVHRRDQNTTYYTC
ncbi:DUF3854 domain-containing protein [Caldanaerobius polysaccharolyticus]|uniref:DUF3854 domain-containing protein n=1 Tax=Caldanaerobius polysaccharolyticus TaxID=44256 RepID=UPI00047A2AD0|nr:DUF3854 domain-containing protein [Caldanaerobius polysaccharolyticus]